MKRFSRFASTILFIIAALIWAVPSAFSYQTLYFNSYGTLGTAGNTYQISGWQLASLSTLNQSFAWTGYTYDGTSNLGPTTGTMTDSSIIVQDTTGGTLTSGNTFNEKISLGVSDFLDASGSGMGVYSTAPSDLNGLTVDLNLNGYISGLSGPAATVTTPGDMLLDSFNSNFYTGNSSTAEMTTGGGTVVADWNLLSYAPLSISPSQWTGGLQAAYSLTFGFNSVTPGFFGVNGTTPATLPQLQLILTIANGSEDFSGDIASNTATNQIITGWTQHGITTIFSPVPEPGTILLLGLGLIGIASLASRRRRKA